MNENWQSASYLGSDDMKRFLLLVGLIAVTSGCTYTRVEWNGATISSWTLFNRRVIGEAQTTMATNGANSLTIRGYESDQSAGAKTATTLLQAYLETLRRMP